MYGRSEVDLKFPTPIPVNITYQTAFVDDAGKLQLENLFGGPQPRQQPAQRNQRRVYAR